MQTRAKEDLLLSIIFSLLSLYLIGTISSQLMFNIGLYMSTLIILQRAMNGLFALCSVFIVVFACKVAGLKIRWSLPVTALFFAFLVALIITSPINLIYRFDITEPIVKFYGLTFTRYFWIVSWVFLGSVLLNKSRKPQQFQERKLLRLSGFSSLSVALGYSLYLVYIVSNNGIFLLSSWLITFFSFSGFLIGNIISPNDPIAEKPLDILKTRILFKLAMLFVLMIVIIVETTSIATISILRVSLSKAVVERDRQIALGISDRVEYYLKQGKKSDEVILQLQADVENISFSQRRIIGVVDSNGRLIAHSDPQRTALREDLSMLSPIMKVLSGKSGWETFFDESNGRMVGAFLPVYSTGWGILVTEPITQAYAETRRMETSSLIFVILGIIIAVIVGLISAKRIELPINAIIFGTEQIRKGNLKYQIVTDSIDEIGRLAKEFNSMTAELKESQDHLIASEKLAALGAMAAGMAHEIKNPLVALRTFTQLFPMKWEDKDFRDKFSAIVPAEIDKINKIAENLLKFGKPSKPEFKHTSINAVLEEVLDLLDNQFKKNNIRVATKMIQLPMINGDPGQLSQAFLNIVLNASQAMPNGGELTVKTDIGHVIQLGTLTKDSLAEVKKIADKASGSEVPVVFVEITDTGSGISEEKMKNMFDPFFTTKESGTGMGLPITLRIIEEHKGSIKVKSQVGKGTTFIIILPQA
ncbi:MAG: ATP-binding protein [Candidatus Saganbacteria bacterium]|nr:ATP-binding protein [Candidatus Saganbacteria bacterium]